MLLLVMDQITYNFILIYFIDQTDNNCDKSQERRMRQLKKQVDSRWLHACLGNKLLIDFQNSTLIINCYEFPQVLLKTILQL